MISITVNGVDTLYSSIDANYPASAIKIDCDIKDAGTADITIPPNSLALAFGNYDYRKPYRDIVEIKRDEELLFRGRLISKRRDVWMNARFTCEGELAMFKDGVIRADTYTGAPSALFGTVVSAYNEQVDTFKRFSVGTVTVTTTESSPCLELEKAVSTAEALAKLREKYGGYITFRTAAGTRYIDWLASLSAVSDQMIEFGSNLLDVAITKANSDYANRIIPFGKKVNDEYVKLSGRPDYVEDQTAQASYGIVAKAVYFSDVEDPATLLIRANAELAERSRIIDTITVSALDLKELANIPQIGLATTDGLDVGLTVRVKSAPHGIDALYPITHRTYDLLNPKNGKITLGGSIVNLTSVLAGNGGI